MTNTAHERRRATPPSDPSNGQLDRDGPVADVWDAASLRMSAENCRLRAESLNRLTGAGEDYIWRPANGARGTLLNVAAILDSIAASRATPPADSPGGDRMGVPKPLPMPEYRFQEPATGPTAQSALYTPPQAGEREQIARIIDPDSWAIASARYNPEGLTAPSLAKADAILALPPKAAPGVVEEIVKKTISQARNLRSSQVSLREWRAKEIVTEATTAILAALSAPRS